MKNAFIIHFVSLDFPQRLKLSATTRSASGLLAILSLICLTSSSAQDYWLQKMDVGGGNREGAVGFSINGKGYIGTGSLYVAPYSYLSNDFWEYDPTTDIWTQKANFGGSERVIAVGFSIGNKGYIGTGLAGGQSQKKDFWEYDPIANSWTQKADFGGTERQNAVGFSIGGKGYIGTGFKHYFGDLSDFWEYDPLTDTWIQKADFGGGIREGAVGFSVGSKGYVGTGFGNDVEDDFWEYDPLADTWTQKADFGGVPRVFATGFSMAGKGYIGNGYTLGPYKNDFWEYDPTDDSWSQKTSFPGTARAYAPGFSIDSTGYVGTGADPGFNNDFWQYNLNCNGITVYLDSDSDGFGNAAASYFALDCIVPFGYSINNVDCNDSVNSIHPGVMEICNNLDDDCNQSIDEGLIFSTYYTDSDGDNYGNAGDYIISCSLIAGYVSDSTDCDDNNGAVNPSGTETCNNIDDDCNGIPDDGLTFVTYYPDADSDGFGDVFDPGDSLCNNPGTGYSIDNSDCDDSNVSVNPTATETCNGLDDDCNSIADDGLIFITYYKDADGDSYGDLIDAGDTLCNNPGAGYSINNFDCDDSNAAINPSAIETCNGLDDDCNQLADEGLIKETYFADADNDGFGNASNLIDSCAQPTGYITDSTDCDDANSSVNPDALEIPNNGIDDNCDGYIDEFGVGISTIENNAPVLSVFPNPTNGVFSTYLKLEDEVNVEATAEVLNLLGQKILSEKVIIMKGVLQKEIQLNDAAVGMCLVKVTVNDRVYSAQINFQK